MGWWASRRNRREKELEEEIAHDLAATADQGVHAGLSVEEAQRAARREFGNVLAIKELVRDAWGSGRTDRFWQDVRYGLRSMRRTPGLTAVIVLTLMLGIGANAVVFSVIHAVLLKPLPYRDPARVMFVTGHVMRFARFDFVDGAELDNWRSQAKSFDSIAGYWATRDTCTTGLDAFDVGIAYVQGEMTRLLGVSPDLGRDFLAEEVQPAPGRSPTLVALISDAVFRQHFAGDRALLGKVTLTVNRVPYVVVGVLPRDLRLALPGLDTSSTLSPDVSLLGIDVVVNRDAIQAGGPTDVLGRLKRGVKLETAQAEIETLHASYSRQHADRPKSDVRIMPLQDRIVGDTRLALLMLWATVCFVLVVACANVANLLLARSAARSREIAVRAALGATRGRIIRQLLTESLTLAFCGGIAGTFLALWAIRLIVTKIAIDIPRIKEAAIDWNVLLFCAGICTVTGILAGLAPALSGSRRNLVETIGREKNAASVSASRRRLHGLLVVAQLTLAVVLVTGAGLMLKSLWVIRSQTAVFAPERVLQMHINARQVVQPDVYLGDLANQIEAVPGVQAAAGFTHAGRPLRIVGLPAPAADQTVMVTVVRVTPHYKAASGVRLVSGRWLSDDDLRGTPRVTVVNDSLMRIVASLYPDNGPILGRQVDLGGKASDNPTIVGIVSALQRQPDADPEPQMFVPASWWPLNGIAQYLVRASGDPMALAGPIQRIVGRTPRVEVRGTQTVEDELLSGLAPRRFQTTLLVTFASLALLLAMAGVYGVLSYGVTERTHEIGVRLALGAHRSRVLLMVIGRAARLAGLGIGIGVIAAAVLSRLIAKLLYGVRPSDLWTYAATGSALFLIAIVAAYVPARRATRVDPAVALRYE